MLCVCFIYVHVCVYECVFSIQCAYTYMCLYVLMCVECVYVDKQTYACVWGGVMYAYVDKHMCTCVYVGMHMCVCVCVWGM